MVTTADLSMHLLALLQVEKQRERLPQTRAKGEDEMNNTIKTLQHKENKLAGAPALCLQQLMQCFRPCSYASRVEAACLVHILTSTCNGQIHEE